MSPPKTYWLFRQFIGDLSICENNEGMVVYGYTKNSLWIDVNSSMQDNEKVLKFTSDQ